MAEFRNFDLGQTIQAAESIKAMRRQGESDKLRDAYMGVQMQNAQQAGQIAGNQEQRAQGEYKAQVDVRQVRQRYLEASEIARAKDPIFAAKTYSPDGLVKHYEATHGAGSFDNLTADEVRALAEKSAPLLAAAAGIDLNGSPEQQFAAKQQKEMAGVNFDNQLKLEGVKQRGDVEIANINANAAKDRNATSNDRQEFRSIQGLRKEFEGMDSVKHYKAVLPLIERARTAPDNRAGDVSVVYALGKMFDPTSAVKEGEIQLSKDTATWVQKIVGEANSQLSSKGALNPETRKGIIKALEGQVDAFAAPYNQERQRFSQYASENGWSADQVVGSQSPGEAFGNKPISPEEAAKLPAGTRFVGADGVTRVKH